MVCPFMDACQMNRCLKVTLVAFEDFARSNSYLEYDYVQRSSSSLYRRLRYRNCLIYITLHYITLEILSATSVQTIF